MKLRKSIAALIVALLIGGFAITGTASADVIGDCTLAGYTFMGGGFAYTNDTKDYLLAQPLEYYYGESNYWGYGWLKFDIGTETVDSAYLVLDILGSGSMSITDLSEENVGDLSIYSAGTTDVDDLADDSTARSNLQSTLYDDDGSLLLATLDSMTSNGLYYIDITDIYNSWVSGTDNNGLVLVSDLGLKIAGIGSEEGSAPYISTTNAVPVPAAAWLLGSGLLGLVGLRRRS
ncbi:VPLPA-CTERM sorting domain-containing protein [uncultured Desulfosarcina sp.]|uniref:VPLPA-CTERM sorting domain-containing protein n=1 Tax=uncultured Desulfosarcina sp. TaxID=218289 RepID=UPI0029C9920C|nr:VPLPA-CTERM sorting domain-containing protein [uncultured Desulfosarcina sp.]